MIIAHMPFSVPLLLTFKRRNGKPGHQQDEAGCPQTDDGLLGDNVVFDSRIEDYDNQSANSHEKRGKKKRDVKTTDYFHESSGRCPMARLIFEELQGPDTIKRHFFRHGQMFP